MTSSDASPRTFGLPRPVVMGGGVLVLLIVAFVVGYVVGNRPVGDLVQQVERLETDLQQNQLLMEQVEVRLDAHRALALVYESMLDVDARNFGTANDRLVRAADILAGIDAEAIGPPAGDLAVIEEEIRGLDIRVAEDLAGQRDNLAELARRFARVLER